MITELNERSREIFKYIVDAYLGSGEPIGSRTISRELELSLSPATIRNVMADLEALGLLHAPHASAGRLPTQMGLRLYVDGLMQIGDLTEDERRHIDVECQTVGHSVNQMYEKAGTLLSGLSAGAGLVIAPKTDKPVRTIQFVRLDNTRVLAVLVMQDGMVENRVMTVSSDLTESALVRAANYLNDKLAGQTLAEAGRKIVKEIETHKTQLDHITEELVQLGIALQPNGEMDGHIIVRGQSRLLQDVRAVEDLERARALFEALEEQETMAKLLEATQSAEGVQIFIGTENRMFEHSGWSMVLSPYKSSDNHIVGAIGVLGPTRLNYGRIIPLVDYTSKVMERLIGRL